MFGSSKKWSKWRVIEVVYGANCTTGVGRRSQALLRAINAIAIRWLLYLCKYNNKKRRTFFGATRYKNSQFLLIYDIFTKKYVSCFSYLFRTQMINKIIMISCRIVTVMIP